METADCSIYKPFTTYWPLHLVLLMQAVCGAISAVLGVYTFLQCRSLYFHVNCKILITSQLAIIIIHSIFIAILQLMHLRKYLFSSTPCHIVTSAITCTLLRFPTTTSYISFVILQFMMVFERTVATCRRADYEKTGPHLGVALLVVAVLFSTMLNLWIIQEENFSNYYEYCSAGSTQTIARLSSAQFGLCAVCITSLVGVLALKIHNRHGLVRKSFYLRESFHLRENKHIVELLYPISIFQALFLFVFAASGAIVPMLRHDLDVITFRTIFSSFYFIPYYTIVTPLIILCMIRRAKQRNFQQLQKILNITNERELYFSNYIRLWNRAPQQ